VSHVRVVAVVGIALLLQVSVFPHVAPEGIVPNLVLLVVVGAALIRGPQVAAVLGFVAGLMIDVAPAADHVAGRWALALVVVGYVAGWTRPDIRLTWTTIVAAVAASSFVGSSVFALTGVLLADPAMSFAELLTAVLVGVVWDVVLTPLVLPPVMRAFRAEPDRSPA
jgi:rod shape-determining protein MreD